MKLKDPHIPHWYAIRTKQDSIASQMLTEKCEEVYYPRETVRTKTGIIRTRAIIPHVIFILTTHEKALELEKESQEGTSKIPRFHIYRNIDGSDIQPIAEKQMKLLKLLTSPDTSGCEIFTKTDFRRGEQVRVTGGIYEGYTGTVQRVKKNKHVIVEIEGICLVMLPFIHPDLLQKL